MRVYIKTEHKESVRELGINLQKHGKLVTDEVSPLSQFYFQIDDTGFFGDGPNVPDGYIKGTTMYLYISDGFVKPGIYEHKDAKAEVDTCTEKVGEFFNEELFVRQDLRIVASSINGAREILSLLRQGKIEPKEEWRGHANRYAYIRIGHPAVTVPDA